MTQPNPTTQRTRTSDEVERLRRAGAPRVIWVAGIVGLVFLLVPLVGLLVQTPWGEVGSIFADSQVAQALWLSLWTSVCTTAIAVLVGVPLAYLLARVPFRGARLLRALVVLPLVLPPVVGGVALLAIFGRSGVFGEALTNVGVTIPFTPVAVMMAQLFVALPFLVITVEGGLRANSTEFEEAAQVLGASRTRTLWTITLPLVRSSIIAGTVLCWARALGEFGATITFAGAFPGSTQTLPIQIYYSLQQSTGAAIALSLLLMLICAAVLIGLRKSWLRQVSGA